MSLKAFKKKKYETPGRGRREKRNAERDSKEEKRESKQGNKQQKAPDLTT
jgi:hypothetical protein